MVSYITVDFVARLVRKILGRKRKLVIFGFAVGLILGYLLGSRYPNKTINKAANQAVEKAIDTAKEKLK